MVVIKSISLEPELIERVQEVANAQNRSFSQTVSRLLQMAVPATQTPHVMNSEQDRKVNTSNPQG